MQSLAIVNLQSFNGQWSMGAQFGSRPSDHLPPTFPEPDPVALPLTPGAHDDLVAVFEESSRLACLLHRQRLGPAPRKLQQRAIAALLGPADRPARVQIRCLQ